MLRPRFSRAALESVLHNMAENADQLAAVASKGHCVVLAGPGSGKTKTLTAAMTRALVEDVEEPRGVACITFNNECALELEGRLSALGVRPDGNVFIGTVHSFAMAHIIAPYAKSTVPGWRTDFRVATEAERSAVVRAAHARCFAEVENPLERWEYAAEKRRRNVDRSHPDWLGTNLELARFVIAYEELLIAEGLIDFDGMPVLAFQIVQSNKWVREALRAKFPQIFVDEYQDLGDALHYLVKELCFASGIRLFAVGDVDQSIYGFGGANPALLEELVARADVSVVRLKTNYRSGQRIIDASMGALGVERGYQASTGSPGGTVLFCSVGSSLEDQAAYIVDTLIPSLHAEGRKLEDIAILYRAAWNGDCVAEAAVKDSLPFIRTDKAALIKRGSRLARFCEACAVWCSYGWKNADPAFERLAREATTLVFGSQSSREERYFISISLIGFLNDYIGKEIKAHTWLLDMQRRVLSDWQSHATNKMTEWDAIQELLTQLAPGQAANALMLSELGGGREAGGRLNLSTLHSAKGREFSVVIMLGVSAGDFPNSRDKKKPGDLVESRRLFYVGVTRPKDALYLVYKKDRPSEWVLELSKRINPESEA